MQVGGIIVEPDRGAVCLFEVFVLIEAAFSGLGSSSLSSLSPSGYGGMYTSYMLWRKFLEYCMHGTWNLEHGVGFFLRET